jgi:hypothetical protein
MAKIKFSALVSDMRNKLNGSVLSKNRYGNYMRNKTTPVNPQTSFQQNARSILASLSQAWAGLTEAQRQGWRSLALTLPFTDIFGDPKTLTGNSLYVSLNANLLKVAQPAIPNPPLKIAIPSIQMTAMTAIRGAAGMTTLTVGILPVVVPAGFSVVVFATPGVGPGITFVKNQYRYIGVAPAAVAGVISIAALWNTRFGNAAIGTKINVRLALVANASGQQGIPSERLAVVA